MELVDLVFKQLLRHVGPWEQGCSYPVSGKSLLASDGRSYEMTSDDRI